MKSLLLTILALFFSLSFATVSAQNACFWRLVWSDEFDLGQIDSSKWSRIPRGPSNWNRYMSFRDDLVRVGDGNVEMLGVLNPDRSVDSVAYLTGGLYSHKKFAFKYGKVEIRARLQSVRGAWPAFWMLPDREGRRWPDDGEIDIMEHLNFDDFVYQTVHSYYTVRLGEQRNPPSGGRGYINRDAYNVYAVQWSEDELVFSINGIRTFSYPRIKTDREGQWPFDSPFYILIDQQLGGKGTWVGEVNHSELPVRMWIDYVRVYQKQDAQK